MDFTNKVILITGAASGIGADAAKYLAKLGGNVAIVDQNENGLNTVANEIQNDKSPTPLIIVADITTDAQRIIDETIAHFGKLNVLINNAGIAMRDNITTFDSDAFDRIMNVNVKAVAILSSRAAPHLAKEKGNIVNVSSVSALKTVQGILSYSMSKAALDKLTQCTALELAPHVRVNSVNPAIIKTSILQEPGLSNDQINAFYDSFKHLYPIGRIGTTNDSSAAIAYLASDLSSFLTGILLPLDGGSCILPVENFQRI